jgi:hypothetical protein
MDDCNCNSSTCDCCVNKPTTIETETITLLTPSYFDDKSVSGLTNAELLATQDVVLDVAATLTLFNTNVLNNVAFDKTEYTFVTDRLAEGAITQTEYREFLNDYNYTADTATNTIRDNPKSHIEQFNDFLKGTIAGVAVSSLCRFLSDPFNKITSAISLFSNFLGGFKTLKDLLASLENPLDALSGLAASLKAFANSLIDSVKDIVNSIKEKVLNVASKINEKLSNIVGMQGPVLANLKKWFSRHFATIQNALSDGNIANLVKDISTKIAEAVLGFAVLTLEAIEFLLFLFCKMATSVENNLISLLDPLNIAANSISPVMQSLSVGSADNTLSAILGGRPVPDPETLSARVQDYTDNVNSTAKNSSNPQNSNYDSSNPRIYPSASNTSHPDPKSWSNLEFKPQILDNPFFYTPRLMPQFDRVGDNIIGYIEDVAALGIDKADGYYGMQLDVLEKMNEVGAFMGYKLYVLSARREQTYNDYLRYVRDGFDPDVAKHSQHRSGHALDIGLARSPDRPRSVPKSESVEFLSLCQKIGFIGFGYYPTFLHCDVSSKRDWNTRPEGWDPGPGYERPGYW